MNINKAIEHLQTLRANLSPEVEGYFDMIRHYQEEGKDTSDIEKEQLKKDGKLEGINIALEILKENRGSNKMDMNIFIKNKLDRLNSFVNKLEDERNETTKRDDKIFLEAEIVGVEQAINMLVSN